MHAEDKKEKNNCVCVAARAQDVNQPLWANQTKTRLLNGLLSRVEHCFVVGVHD